MKSDPKVIVEAPPPTVNVPIACKENAPLEREYIRSEKIQELAVQKYHNNGKANYPQ
jgi:hypothetical protein